MIDQLTASIGYIRDGKLKPLAVTSLTRSPLLPNVPTLDEPRRERLRSEHLHRHLRPRWNVSGRDRKAPCRTEKSPRQRAGARALSRNGRRYRRYEPAQFADYVRADLEKWRKVAREGNIVVE